MSIQVVKQAITASGLDRYARALLGGVGAVLMFHSVERSGSRPGWRATEGLGISPEALEEFIDTLQAEGYALVTASEAAQLLSSGATDKRFAALTFDDGYRDNHELLLPLLQRRNAKATVYVSTGFIDRQAPHASGAPMWWFGVERALTLHDRVTIRAGGKTQEFPARTDAERTDSHERIGALFLHFTPAETRAAVDALKSDYGIDCYAIADGLSMDWDMVRALHRSGLVEIGGHAISHCPLAAMDDPTAWTEIDQGRKRLAEQLGYAPVSFAYPYGIKATVSARDIALVKRAGYVSAYTTQQRPLLRADAAHPHALPRIGMGGDDDSVNLRLRLSGIRADRLPYAA